MSFLMTREHGSILLPASATSMELERGPMCHSFPKPCSSPLRVALIHKAEGRGSVIMAAQGLATALEQEGVWLLPAPLQSVFRLRHVGRPGEEQMLISLSQAPPTDQVLCLLTILHGRQGCHRPKAAQPDL